MLDFRLYTFLKLCEIMNYRITAEKLNMTQPAVTQHIQYLEKEYSCKLFHYNGRKLSKTEEAEKLEAYTRAAVYNDKAIRESMAVQKTKNIRVGATKTIGDFVIKDIVTDFIYNRDNNLSLVVDNTELLLHKIDNNELDFALVEGFFDKQKYGYKLFRNEPFIGICSKSHPFAGRSVTLEELFSQTVIIREKGSGTRAILEHILFEYSFSLDNFFRQICISSFQLIKHIVSKKIGISFVYEVIAKTDSNLAEFTVKGLNISREFNYVFLKKTTAEERIKEFELNVQN